MSPNTASRDPGMNAPRHISGQFPGTLKEYKEFLMRMRDQRNEFWRSCAGQLSWDTPFSTVVEENFNTASISWFSDGTLNAAANALDYHVSSGNGNRPALATLDQSGLRTVSYEDLRRQSALLAGALAEHGIAAGARVALYLPNCSESVLIMLACARLGITVVPIPARFTAEVTAEIIRDCGASLLAVNLNPNAGSAYDRTRDVIAKAGNIPVITTGPEPGGHARTLDQFTASGGGKEAAPASVGAEHPLFVLYANSASGIPRGSVFATGGYLVQSFAVSDVLFSFRPATAGSVLCNVPLCSAAGMSLGFWGPLLCGKTLAFLEENMPVTPEVLERYASSLESPAFLTTPRTIAELRLGMENRKLPEPARFTLIASAGDTLTPRLVSFAGTALTAGSSRVLNLWSQNETGTALISTFPVPDLNRAGSLGLPFPGIEPMTLNNFGEPCRSNESGQLVFLLSWPAMIRTILNQPERFRELYFNRFPGNFSTNDGVRIDTDGFFWFMGRLDDVINVRGQLLSTAEIEAVLISHPEISEVAVISPEADEMDRLYAFLVPATGIHEDIPAGGSLEQELKNLIVRRIGEFAVPTRFIFSSGLPRTRTGKIVRRVLRRVISGDISLDDDLSHVANPQTVEELIRKKGS